MSGGTELHGPAGLAIALLLALSLIATFLLIGAALRRDPRGGLARLAAVGFAAAIVRNWVGHVWSALQLLLWACVPLDALAIVIASIALHHTRGRISFRHDDDSTHVVSQHMFYEAGSTGQRNELGGSTRISSIY